MTTERLFKVEQPTQRPFTIGDGIVLVGVAGIFYAGVRLAFNAPAVVTGPEISLSPRALPWYALLSTARMVAAYALSMLFALIYGRAAARHRSAERVMMPLLDVLQSVPILSFLPVVLLGLTALLPENVAVELASIVLIFTSQAWNLTFSWYQSSSTAPSELREASAIFRFNGWLHFKTLELPFAIQGLLWNSMMSWSGGWFFLMAAEIFTLGQRDFRLPGLGAYLKEAADQGNRQAILWGIAALVLVIVALDQFAWRPLLAWADRFKLETVEGAQPPSSWFYRALRRGRVADWLSRTVSRPAGERLDAWMLRRSPAPQAEKPARRGRSWAATAASVLLAGLLIYGGFLAVRMLANVPPNEWAGIAAGLGATLLRVTLALIIGLAWTIPVGVAIGTNPRLAFWLQPVVQVSASVPATALFPVFLLLLIGLPNGMNLAALLLMLLGTQWYLLFNIIAGAAAIPQDLKYTAALIQVSRWERWRTLMLPALFPFIVTGAITASGGAWNASIVAEYMQFGGQTLHTVGIGAVIAQATAAGDYPLLLAATLSMVLLVVLINRLLWRRLYRLAEDRYRME